MDTGDSALRQRGSHRPVELHVVALGLQASDGSEADEPPMGAAAAAPANPRAVAARAPTVAAIVVKVFMILLLWWCSNG